MKYLIASDLHGSLSAAEAVLARLTAEKADRLILLGDLLYHGPRNDLPDQYNPKGVIALLNALPVKPLAVRGNCDAEIDQMVLEFPIMADYALLPLRNNRTAFITHGHLFNLANRPPISRAICCSTVTPRSIRWRPATGLPTSTPVPPPCPRKDSRKAI